MGRLEGGKKARLRDGEVGRGIFRFWIWDFGLWNGEVAIEQNMETVRSEFVSRKEYGRALLAASAALAFLFTSRISANIIIRKKIVTFTQLC